MKVYLGIKNKVLPLQPCSEKGDKMDCRKKNK
jgi:hypothetical protein